MAATAPSWTPLQYLWKSRVPLVVVPLLAGLQSLGRAERQDTALSTALDVLLLVFLALGTGYVRLPFSTTWWLVMLAAFATQTRLLLGVATVLSLSVLLTWYGLRLRHAAAVTALWRGATLPRESQLLWQLWDLGVHLIPALVVLYTHAPCLLGGSWRGAAAAALTAPLSLLWLCGRGFDWGGAA
ncbi:unnamed protein product [Effrenium voratum]|nr:unnamed protein product [Effrenium voratum]